MISKMRDGTYVMSRSRIAGSHNFTGGKKGKAKAEEKTEEVPF